MSLDIPFERPIADYVTKKALVDRICDRLEQMHVEKLKALAIMLDA